MRDAGDDIASTVFKYGTEEVINKTVKINLVKFAESMATIGDLGYLYHIF